jgi:hypothetical protein
MDLLAGHKFEIETSFSSTVIPNLQMSQTYSSGGVQWQIKSEVTVQVWRNVAQ